MRTMADRRLTSPAKRVRPMTPPSMRHRPHSGVLAFDVGGTYMRAGIYDPASDRVASVRRRLSPNYLSNANAAFLPEELMKALADLGSEVLSGQRATTVSLAFPAPIDSDGNALAVPTSARRPGPSQSSYCCRREGLLARGARFRPKRPHGRRLPVRGGGARLLHSHRRLRYRSQSLSARTAATRAGWTRRRNRSS